MASAACWSRKRSRSEAARDPPNAKPGAGTFLRASDEEFRLVAGRDDNRRRRHLQMGRDPNVLQDKPAIEFASIISHHHRTRLVVDQPLVIDDAGRDRLREFWR